jgi:gas vesicle protein
MASATIKKTCAKCNKGGGTAICYGCEQTFCTKHFIEHRQELSEHIDNIGQEHDVLRRDLTNEQGIHPLLARINQWEQESIIKIQIAAKSARTDLQQLLSKTKNNLKTSVSKMTEELQSSRESDDYTELDIKKWTNQLQGFRKMLDSPTSVKIDYENDLRSAIRLIKVNDQQSSGFSYPEAELSQLANLNTYSLETTVDERFADTFGKMKLSQSGLVAMCLNDDQSRCYTSGVGQYSSGVHHIRFGIEQLDDVRHYVFLGIVNSLEKMSNDVLNSTSRHGWWDLDDSVVSGKLQRDHFNKIIRTGDKVTLTLDCDSQRIQLEHHRTKRIVNMPINLRLCQFPWKIVVILIGKNACVKIL